MMPAARERRRLFGFSFGSWGGDARGRSSALDESAPSTLMASSLTWKASSRIWASSGNNVFFSASILCAQVAASSLEPSSRTSGISRSRNCADAAVPRIGLACARRFASRRPCSDDLCCVPFNRPLPCPFGVSGPGVRFVGVVRSGARPLVLKPKWKSGKLLVPNEF